jgi:CBS domain-containing protein
MSIIRDVMSKDFKFVTPETSVQEAAQKMRDLDFGFLPVGENDKLIGMITDRDIVIRSSAKGQNPSSTPVRDVMTAKTYYCYDDQSVEEICDNMSEIKVRRLPVVNRDKRLVGVVSLGDVAQAAHRAKTGDALQEITVECASHAKAA